MSAGFGWQYVVIGVVVAVSCAVMVRKLAPVWSARRLAAIAAYLSAPRRGALARWLGRRLTARSGDTADGCDSGCSSCCGCGSSSDSGPPDESPLTFRPVAARKHSAAAPPRTGGQ